MSIFLLEKKNHIANHIKIITELINVSVLSDVKSLSKMR